MNCLLLQIILGRIKKTGQNFLSDPLVAIGQRRSVLQIHCPVNSATCQFCARTDIEYHGPSHTWIILTLLESTKNTKCHNSINLNAPFHIPNSMLCYDLKHFKGSNYS